MQDIIQAVIHCVNGLHGERYNVAYESPIRVLDWDAEAPLIQARPSNHQKSRVQCIEAFDESVNLRNEDRRIAGCVDMAARLSCALRIWSIKNASGLDQIVDLRLKIF